MFLPGTMWFPLWTFLVKLALKLHPLSLTMSPHLIIDAVCFLCKCDFIGPSGGPQWQFPVTAFLKRTNEHLESPKVPCLAQYLFHYSVRNTLKSSKPDQTRVYKYLKGCKTSQEGPEQLESPSQFPQIRVHFVPSHPSPRWLMNVHTVLRGNGATSERWWSTSAAVAQGGAKTSTWSPCQSSQVMWQEELCVFGRFKLFLSLFLDY